jgi:SAM-dependent methyltransferase
MTEGTRSRLFETPSIPVNYRRYLLPTIFEPSAARLVRAAQVDVGHTVIDVASGTGAVARAAATAAGPRGRVIASDISPAMLGEVPTGADPAGAVIELLEAPATRLPLADGIADVVLCQHGLPFVADKAAAVDELRRVLRPGGTVGIVVWVAARRLEPFDSYGDILRDEGIDEPFPRAFDFDSFKMSAERLRELLASVGDVRLTTETRELGWPSVEAAVNGIFGTPYGPVLAALDPGRREHAFGHLRERMAAAPRPVVTALLATGTA